MADHTLRSRQMNPCDQLFWKSRGYSERPYDWEYLLEEMDYFDSDDDNKHDDYLEYFENYCGNDEYYDDQKYYGDVNYDFEHELERLRSLQHNPNNDEYWRERGFSRRPDNWRERVIGNGGQSKRSSHQQSTNNHQASSTHQPRNQSQRTMSGNDVVQAMSNMSLNREHTLPHKPQASAQRQIRSQPLNKPSQKQSSAKAPVANSSKANVKWASCA